MRGKFSCTQQGPVATLGGVEVSQGLGGCTESLNSWYIPYDFWFLMVLVPYFKALYSITCILISPLNDGKPQSSRWWLHKQSQAKIRMVDS